MFSEGDHFLGSLTRNPVLFTKSMGCLERKSVNKRSREGKGRRWNKVPWILFEFVRGGMKERTDKLNTHTECTRETRETDKGERSSIKSER